MQTSHDLPDVSHLGPNMHRFVATQFFQNTAKPDLLLYALVLNFVRLSDFAVIEYANARQEYMHARDTSDAFPIGSFSRAASHLETCIDSLKRLINLLKKIRSSRVQSVSIKSALPRSVLILSGQVEHQVTKLRDASQHLEKHLVFGDLPSGTYMVPIVSGNSLIYGNFAVPVADIVAWVTEAHGIAARLSEIRQLSS